MALKAIGSLLILLIALNAWGWQSAGFGLVLGLAYLIILAYLFGGRLANLGQGLVERLGWGLILFSLALSIVGSLAFYLDSFSTAVAATVLAFMPWFGRARAVIKTREAGSGSYLKWVIGLAYLVLAALTLLSLASAQTQEAIRTPWAVVPNYVFLLFGLTAASYLALVYVGSRHTLWLVPFFLLSLSVLGLVYPLGFGFDPLIHQASEKLLTLSGTISPKPFYYLGQYSLVTALAWLLSLPVAAVDTWLVPVLASLGLPIALAMFLRTLKLERLWLGLLPLTPLAFTLAQFTYTTPQGLANLWALMTVLVLAAQSLGQARPRYLPWIMALAALAAHPLTGLPLLGLVTLFELTFGSHNFGGARRKLIWYAAAAATTLVVPVSFAVFSWLKPGAAQIKLGANFIQRLGQLGQNIWESLPLLPRFIDTGDAVYMWGRPLVLIFILLAISGWIYSKETYSRLRFFALSAGLMTAGYLVLRLGATFPNLPLNEQDFYTSRLWDLALLCLLPLALVGAYGSGQWIMSRLPSPIVWVTGGALLLTASFYLAYPRLDNWHRDAAYNTTPSDLEAVRLVEQKAADVPYVVLSNQAVSAAAVAEYGFTHYYAGNFYYPLPTGTNPLYKVYLNAAEHATPTREIVSEASKLAQVPQVFLVLNRYWADFDKLSAVAKKEADESWSVAQGRLQVFRYDF